ncbi:hypothetical protein [Roseiconus lacunae]|uniref:hypothetical protein n=1 Tax=Roseiconus lacunae TaxID=2605694 RepID=UPI001E424F5F|nr:hypothetical protein [Roseiconus lacunae]MCD0458639.1 hypothetical protein [Roseiconus lacunae]
MKSDSIPFAVAIIIATVGCGRDPPKLTQDQVEQLFDAQKTLAEEQAALGRGRDALEEDRRRWAERQRTDPIIAMSIQGAAMLIACSLPMAILALLLASRRRSENVDSANILEAIELVSNRSEMLPNRSTKEKLASPAKGG